MTATSNRAKFHITIGAAPHGSTNLEHDLRMVKAALLYGDAAKLCSPTSSIMLQVLVLGELKTKQQLEFLESIAPQLTKDVEQVTRVQQAINVYRQLNRKSGTGKRLNQAELKLQMMLKQGFTEQWVGVKEIVNKMAEEAGAAGLIRALQSGLLELHPFNDWEGDGVVKEFWSVVSGAVLDGTTYPLFDQPTGDLVRAGIKEGIVEVSDAARARAQHSALAGHLLERLPLFDEATIDEILDVRRELDKPLVRFRSAMIKFSEDMKSAAWDADFQDDVATIFYRDVAPAILDIEEQVKSNKQLLPLANKLLGDLGTGTLVAILVSQAQVPDVLAQALGVGVGGLRVAQNVRDTWKEKQSKVEQNQLFFYYRAGKLLKKKSGQ